MEHLQRKKSMKNNLDINKITAEVITDLAKSTAQTLYKKNFKLCNRYSEERRSGFWICI